MSEGYVVKFRDGYYANRQPNYKWSFVKDVSDALRYKTLNNAVKRSKACKSNYGLGEIVKVGNDNSVLDNYDTLEEMVRLEEERLRKKFTKSCEEDGDDIEEFIKEKIMKYIDSLETEA